MSEDQLEKVNDTNVIPSIYNASTVSIGNVMFWPGRWDVYPLTEHELDMLELKGQDSSLDLNAFIACSSSSLAIIATLTIGHTTTASDRWWVSVLVSLVGLAVFFGIRWIKNRKALARAIAQIKERKAKAG